MSFSIVSCIFSLLSGHYLADPIPLFMVYLEKNHALLLYTKFKAEDLALNHILP